MFNFGRLFLLALACVSGVSASAMPRALTPAGAAYFIIDDPAQKVVAVNVESDGSLGPFARVFDAGGAGQRVTHVTPPGAPPVLFSPGPDPLFGQGSVRVHQQAGILVTINPGSSTVALFKINSQDPTKLTLVGKPVSSGGQFPSSVTINKKGTVACVLNGGVVNGVSCFDIHPTGLVPKPNTQRFFKDITQTTPPVGPLGTVSTLIFSDDEKALLCLVKAVDGNTNGYLAAWAINPDGSLSNDYVKSYPSNGGSVPFALEHIPNSSAYIAVDPSIGFVTFDFKNSSSLAATTAVTTPIPNQILNCWVSYSPKSGNFYITDPALSLVNEVHYDANLNPTLVKQYQQLPTSDTLDSNVAVINNHAYLYVLQPNATSITVLSVDKPGAASHVQTFNLTPALKAAGLASWNRLNFQGMANFIRH
ncbi:hypothetical protein CVT26_011571 [Gymnopilus dilepis]|uniref:3-carboxymuconate cyclase n=1 Tax=Gymnopilus dilepis TaxID=231916 RepID=A0A409YQP1_9AGAR|nr:hypothetical protein CVT26_011571 [Gymnopilus dilepis]